MSAFKETLMIALHDAVQNYNQSGDPNQAVIKSAEAHDFNVDQATRLLETFNTARTIYHYKTASDRTKEFPLADPSVVIPSLFKNTPVPKSAETTNKDYSDYEILEAEYRNGLVIDKAAGVQGLDLGAPKEYLDIDLNATADQAYRIINIQRDLAKTARDESSVAGTKASQILASVAAMVKVGYEDEVMTKYNRLMNSYQNIEQYKPVMEKLAEHMPTWIKAGFIESDTVVDDRGIEALSNRIDEAKTWMEAEAEMLAVAAQMEKEANDFEAEWLTIILPNFPEAKVAEVSDLINFDMMKKAQALPKQAPASKGPKPLPPSPIETGVNKGIEGNISDLVGGLGQAFAGPQERENKALSERLKNVQRQIMLEDLVTTDPVLSSESPETVSKAYGAILALAPDVASNKEVVRAVLRQAVHSVAISPYEAEVWTELEKNIRSLTGRPGGQRTAERGAPAQKG